MRLLKALGVFVLTLVVMVILFAILAVPSDWNALGTVIAIVAAVAYYRGGQQPMTERESDGV